MDILFLPPLSLLAVPLLVLLGLVLPLLSLHFEWHKRRIFDSSEGYHLENKCIFDVHTFYCETRQNSSQIKLI